MMSRAACSFLSIDAHHQYCGSTSAFHTHQSTNNHNLFRHSDATSSFHGYKHIRRTTTSSSHWSLQAQQDDGNIPSRKRRRRQAKNENTNNDDDDGNSDTITSILFKPVPIPFSDIGKSNKRQTMPAIYSLALIGTIAVLPPITSTMVAIFFGVYLVLLLPILDEYDDISLDKNDEQDNDEKHTIVAAPSVAFLGAVASAALLSPQGLVVSSEDENGLLLSSVPYLLAALVVSCGGYVLFNGVNETAKDTRRWDREEMDALPERRERSVMNQWDDELKEKEDGLN
uniref:Uncharacterized protein n=1 Tax=Skeletonema marinoi TaxID=267567 RepID=A0A7S2PX52_9STRA|mmetsp:Transcript_4423/g.7635  ORF Transcript_4423/g.7635 Transcript_4423/m.7635 type:complete len:285 (+) Transcript_4423:115-969(+)